MKIIRIFEPHLYAFHFPNETENALMKLWLDWSDTEKMNSFLKEHEVDWRKRGYDNLNTLRLNLTRNAQKFEDLISVACDAENPKLDELFAALFNSEYKREINLSKRKAKNAKRDNFLRIYALKIDSNCYVVTGGAIKFTDFMEERPHTQNELDKLEVCRNFLRANGVVDEDSFYDFLLENYDQ